MSVPHLIFVQFLHILMVDALYSTGDFILSNTLFCCYPFIWGLFGIGKSCFANLPKRSFPDNIYLKKEGDKYRFDSSPFSTVLPMTMRARTYGPPRPVEHQRRRGVGQQISRESGNFKAIYTRLPAVRPTRGPLQLSQRCPHLGVHNWALTLLVIVGDLHFWKALTLDNISYSVGAI